MSETVKYVVDAGCVVAVGAMIMQLLTPLAALVTITWGVMRIYTEWPAFKKRWLKRGK